jgi:hypothetical protein
MALAKGLGLGLEYRIRNSRRSCIDGQADVYEVVVLYELICAK